MTNKLTEQAELLAATLGITTKEAEEMLQDSIVENQLSLNSSDNFLVCEDPFTGTIEHMYLRNKDV